MTHSTIERNLQYQIFIFFDLREREYVKSFFNGVGSHIPEEDGHHQHMLIAKNQDNQTRKLVNRSN